MISNINAIINKVLEQFITILYRFGKFRRELGEFGNFGLVSPYAVEAAQTVYKLN